MNTQPTIRPYLESDLDEMVAAARESVAEVFPWMAWCHPGYSADEAAAWIRATRDGHASGGMFEFAIIDADGAFAGGCGINHINRVDRFANLGYWIRTSRAGRGIVPAAVRLLVSWAFANTELNRIEIVAAVRNFRSQRVAEKVGAHRDGVIRKRMMVGGVASDAVMYSIIRPD
jgi:ribosomal-protein-serine acetyltransferase